MTSNEDEVPDLKFELITTQRALAKAVLSVQRLQKENADLTLRLNWRDGAVAIYQRLLRETRDPRSAMRSNQQTMQSVRSTAGDKQDE